VQADVEKPPPLAVSQDIDAHVRTPDFFSPGVVEFSYHDGSAGPLMERLAAIYLE
jgi:hypothetical protein